MNQFVFGRIIDNQCVFILHESIFCACVNTANVRETFRDIYQMIREQVHYSPTDAPSHHNSAICQ